MIAILLTASEATTLDDILTDTLISCFPDSESDPNDSVTEFELHLRMILLKLGKAQIHSVKEACP